MAVFNLVCNKRLLKCRLVPIVQYLLRPHTTNSKYEKTNTQDTFKVLYKWPTMKHFRIISRLKIFQAGIMTLSVPPLTYWYLIGHVSGDSLIMGCSAAVGTILILCCLSYSFSRVLGELSYCHSTQTVCLSYLNFLGQRCNTNVKTTDIISYLDTQSILHNNSNSYVNKLETVVSNTGPFYYSLKYGVVINRGQLNQVLGLH